MNEFDVKKYKAYEEERSELHGEIEAMQGTLQFIQWIKGNQKNNFPNEVGVRRIRYKAVINWFKNLIGRNIATVKADYPTINEFKISEEDIQVMTDWRMKRIHELSDMMKEL